MVSFVNPDLDIQKYAREFAEKGRVKIPNFLSEPVAEAIHHCLTNEVPWDLAYWDGDDKKSKRLHQREWQQKSAQEQQEFVTKVRANQDSFNFIYDTFMMVSAYQEKREPQLILHRVLESINAPEYHQLIRMITGFQDFVKIDAQATRYSQGQFLRLHNDHSDEHGRYAAYVMGFTKDWQTDWGGLLEFTDENRNPVDTIVPEYNSLSIFAVPQWHYVSPVASYANKPRLSITGWLRKF